MSLLRMMHRGAMRSYGSMGGTSFVRFMGVLKIPATDPVPDWPYEPEEFFGGVVPTQEALQSYTKIIKTMKEKKEANKTEAYEIDFDAMRERAKDPRNIFPTVEDIDRQEKYLRSLPVLVKDPDYAYWGKWLADVKERLQNYEQFIEDLEKDDKRIRKYIGEKLAEADAFMKALPEMTIQEMLEKDPTIAVKAKEEHLSPDEPEEDTSKSELFEAVKEGMKEVMPDLVVTEEEFDRVESEIAAPFEAELAEDQVRIAKEKQEAIARRNAEIFGV
ncbi:hypothetical protein NDN08_003611 [Rhodosorus marinus]|uniref:ATP synthase subunit d, mitochondrial n=1 Tax=Rhodosorus marinus TaxID=101924 RepID=A0AAV8UX29_9RHOD|nr:hypothetical protein NDN08_003611 [Rhodosorus marinus]